jgi:hypothetical protein
MVSFPSGSVGWDFILLFSNFICTKERANRNRNCKCVKPYTPKFDALNQKTELDDEETAQKKRLSILFSLSCSFYFTPSKGKAEGVEKENKRFCLKNYATFGVGNYGTFIGSYL